MGLSTFVGSFNIDTTKTASQTQAITGVGFQPKAIIFFWSGTARSTDGFAGENISAGFSFAAGPSTITRACVNVVIDDAAATTASRRTHSISNVVKRYATGGASTSTGQVDITSMDSDGFTLTYSEQFGSALRVSYLALGGTDLTNAVVGWQAMPIVVGNYSITGLGFQPDALITFGGGLGTTTGNTADVHFHVGLTDGTRQNVIGAFDNGGVATTDSEGYGHVGENVLGRDQTTNWGQREKLISFDADGFTMNHMEGTSGGYYFFYLALKGLQFKAGSVTTATTLSNVVETGVGFQPSALLLISANRAVSTDDTPTADAQVSIGAGTSATNRAAAAFFSGSALADSLVDSANYDTAIYANVKNDAIDALMDVVSMDSDGFTLTMDDAETSASWVGYLAIGPAASAVNKIHRLPLLGVG